MMVESEESLKEQNKDPVLNGTSTSPLEMAESAVSVPGHLMRTQLSIISVEGDQEGFSNRADPEANHKSADFEKAIQLTGYGKFHYLLLAVCGFVSTSEEMDVISMSFILPSAQCDLQLNTHTKGWLNSIIFIGMMVGAYVWGSIADSLGRKKVLVAISLMNGLCIVASSFSQSYELFMLFRFLNGAALGGSGPVIWSYFAEFQPKAKRGSMLSFMAAFWTLGNLFVACLAWLIIPSGIGLHWPTFIYNSWQIFLLVCSLPSFAVAALLLLLPESPKFLQHRGKQDKALEVFRRIYHVNTGKDPSTYPITQLIDDISIENVSNNATTSTSAVNLSTTTTTAKTTSLTSPAILTVTLNPDTQTALYTSPIAHPDKAITPDSLNNENSSVNVTTNKFRTMVGDIMLNSKQLFLPPILRFTLISITINLTFHIGYYGLMMWFPELFNRFDEFSRSRPGEQASVCEVAKFVTQQGSQGKTSPCSDRIESQVFMESLVTVAAALPSNIIAVLGMDHLGRKFFLVFSTWASGICAVGMYFVYTSEQNLIVSAVFSSVISCGNAALDCLITEVFPTNLRATGVAISMVAARLGGIIGNIVIATLLDLYCPAPTFIVAGLLIGGGMLCLFLPNTTREPLS